MGSGLPNDSAADALLILRAIRSGIAQIDERAEHIIVDEEPHRLSLYTDDGSCVTTAVAIALREALEA